MSEATISATQGATAPSGQPPKRRIRNYLIDSSIQLRFASYLVGVAVAIGAVLGYLLWRSYRESSRLVALDPQVNDALAAILARKDRVAMVWLVAALVAIALILLFLAIVITHRVAGPTVALSKTCRRVASGDLSRPRPLRRKDLLVDLADEVALMVEALREREEKERLALTEVALDLRRSGAGDAAQEAAARIEQLAGDKAARVPP